MLRWAEVDTLVLVGVATDVAVESTARSACDLGYRTIVVSDACAAHSDEAHARALEVLQKWFGETPTADEVLTARGYSLAGGRHQLDRAVFLEPHPKLCSYTSRQSCGQPLTALASASGRAAVLLSWEDRFGARLLQVGFDEIRLQAERPPRTPQAARHVAAEHFAFGDTCAGKGLCDIPGTAAELLSTPIWTFR